MIVPGANIHQMSHFNINWHDVPIRTKETVTYEDYANIWFQHAIVQEYYKNQIEFNIGWSSIEFENLHKFIDVIPDHLAMTWQEPAYVGTHVHMIIKDNIKTISRRLCWKKYKVFLALLKFLNNYFDKAINILYTNTARESMERSRNKYHQLLANELKRIINNHNINIYRDRKIFKRELTKTKHAITRLEYHYTNWSNKPKYQPMLRASATSTGKPLTLEIRSIPNMVALSKHMPTLILEIQRALNSKKKVWETSTIRSLIHDERKSLCHKYKALIIDAPSSSLPSLEEITMWWYRNLDQKNFTL